MVAFYLFITSVFANIPEEQSIVDIQLPSIHHISQPLSVSFEIVNSSTTQIEIQSQVAVQNLSCNGELLQYISPVDHPPKLHPHQTYRWKMQYQIPQNCIGNVSISYQKGTADKEEVYPIHMIQDQSLKPFWKGFEGRYFVFSSDGLLLWEGLEKPQLLTWNYDILGIQTQSAFETCIQKVKTNPQCYKLARPSADFQLLDGNMLYHDNPALLIKQKSRLSLLVFANPLPYFVSMASYVPSQVRFLENQDHPFWLFYSKEGLDVIRPSRSNDPKHPMSGTRLLRREILFADFVQTDNLYIEAIYISQNTDKKEIVYETLTLHGVSKNQKVLGYITKQPVQIQKQDQQFFIEFEDKSTQQFTIEKTTTP